LYVD